MSNPFIKYEVIYRSIYQKMKVNKETFVFSEFIEL